MRGLFNYVPRHAHTQTHTRTHSRVERAGESAHREPVSRHYANLSLIRAAPMRWPQHALARSLSCCASERATAAESERARECVCERGGAASCSPVRPQHLCQLDRSFALTRFDRRSRPLAYTHAHTHTPSGTAAVAAATATAATGCAPT